LYPTSKNYPGHLYFNQPAITKNPPISTDLADQTTEYREMWDLLVQSPAESGLKAGLLNRQFGRLVVCLLRLWVLASGPE
jgi:hypothetical protein